MDTSSKSTVLLVNLATEMFGKLYDHSYVRVHDLGGFYSRKQKMCPVFALKYLKKSRFYFSENSAPPLPPKNAEFYSRGGGIFMSLIVVSNQFGNMRRR